jgi:hypothetical protein
VAVINDLNKRVLVAAEIVWHVVLNRRFSSRAETLAGFGTASRTVSEPRERKTGRSNRIMKGMSFEYDVIRAKTQQTVVDFLNDEIVLASL